MLSFNHDYIIESFCYSTEWKSTIRNISLLYWLYFMQLWFVVLNYLLINENIILNLFANRFK